MSNNLDRLGYHFNKKEYSSVAKIIAENKDLQFQTIETEEHAEVAALAAFSFFNLKEFDTSLFYSLKLIRHIEAKNQTNEARDLYESLILITADAYMRLGRRMRAYSFVKDKMDSVIAEADELQLRFNNVKEDIAGIAAKYLNYWFVAIGFMVVIFQQLFHFLDATTYMGMLIGSMILIFLTWKQHHVLLRLLKKLL